MSKNAVAPPTTAELLSWLEDMIAESAKVVKDARRDKDRMMAEAFAESETRFKAFADDLRELVSLRAAVAKLRAEHRVVWLEDEDGELEPVCDACGVITEYDDADLVRCEVISAFDATDEVPCG